MKIVLSALGQTRIIPVVPNGIKLPLAMPKTETFETVRGELSLIGNPGLRFLPWESILPAYEYGFMQKGAVANPKVYINFFKKLSDKKIPLKVIASQNGKVELSMQATVEGFDYAYDKVGDAHYSINLKEYVNPVIKKL